MIVLTIAKIFIDYDEMEALKESNDISENLDIPLTYEDKESLLECRELVGELTKPEVDRAITLIEEEKIQQVMFVVSE